MFKKFAKKLAVRFLAIMLAVCSLPAVSLLTGSNVGVTTVYAAGGVYSKLMSLKNKFPQGAYWNHVVPDHEAWQNCYNEAYADSVTWTPCATHAAVVGAGTVDCNYFDGGWQCCGFARKIFYDLFGERESSNSLIRIFDPNSVSVGDYVHFKSHEHYAVVLSVSDSTFTVVECNLSGSGSQYNCYINWGKTYSKSQIDYYVHSHNYAAVDNTNTPVSVRFAPWGNGNYTYIGETDASIGQQINVSGGNWTEVGMLLYDKNNREIARGSERPNTSHQYYYYKINEELHYTLSPGTTYKYRFFTVVDGKTYCSDYQSFTTQGTPSGQSGTLKKNPMTLQITSKTLWMTGWYSESFNIGVRNAKGKVTYTLNAAAKKAGIKVNSNGKVTVPKKCKKGTYQITVKAAGNSSYKSAKKKVVVYVK